MILRGTCQRPSRTHCQGRSGSWSLTTFVPWPGPPPRAGSSRPRSPIPCSTDGARRNLGSRLKPWAPSSSYTDGSAAPTTKTDREKLDRRKNEPLTACSRATRPRGQPLDTPRAVRCSAGCLLMGVPAYLLTEGGWCQLQSRGEPATWSQGPWGEGGAGPWR